MVHNGIVENYLELKRELQSRGHQFSSETDTEVIAHLVEEGLSQGLCFEEAFRRTGGIVQGSQAIAATCEGDEKLCVLRLGHAGGIVVAHKDGNGVIGSDLPAIFSVFQNQFHSDPVAFLDAGEMAVLTRDGVKYCDLDGTPLDKQLRGR